jgi:hypothetical protein
MAIIKTPAHSPTPRRTTLGGRSVGHGFSRDKSNVGPSAHLHVARIASDCVFVGHGFTRDTNDRGTARFRRVARIASPLRRRSRTPLPLPLPLQLQLPFSLNRPQAPFLIDNFPKSRAIRNRAQPAQNKSHHHFLIDNFHDPLFPFSSPPPPCQVVKFPREAKQ